MSNHEAIGRWIRPALVVGVAALGVGLVTARGAESDFLRCYVIAWLFIWGMSVGSLALVMILHLTGGVWGLAVRRILEAQMSIMPLVALLFVPIGLYASRIYPWEVHSAGSGGGQDFRARYFETQFVVIRAVIYCALWIALSWLLRHWSRQQEGGHAVAAEWKCHNLSGPGLVIYGLTLHFAAIDWMMSLELPFTSTIYGPIVAACQLLSAFALAVVVLTTVSRQMQFSAALWRPVLSDLGNLLLALVLVWAYLIWCQAMLIWMADLRRDNTWWLVRAEGPWPWVTIGGTIAGLVVPLFMLLSRSVKRNPTALACAALLLLVMQPIFLTYQIAPGSPIAWRSAAWLLPLSFTGLGGIWLAAFLWSLGRTPLTPMHDRNWEHSRHLERLQKEEICREEALAHG
jgi:hypothetical protein